MELVFSQRLWGLILLGSLLLAAGITYLMYRRQGSRELTPPQRRMLIVLRFLSVFLISLLLTVPLVKTIKKLTRHPLVVVAVDNSRSMTGLAGSDERRDELLSLVSALEKELGNRYEVVTYTFGEKSQTTVPPDFGEKRSDYSQMLNTVYNNHFNENLGALVIVGDGSYNQGENPLNNAGKLMFPLYTLGIGDTAVTRDARIAGIRVNKTAFAGNQFPLEADLQVTGGGVNRLQFSILKEGERVATQSVVSSGPSWFTSLSFTLPANGKGLQYYTAVVENLPGEQNKSNNSWTFVINILENKQKIAILSGGVHPDAGALKNSLEQQSNYEVSLFTTEPYPADLSEYNLIILNQLPNVSNSMRQIVEDSRQQRIPLLVIIGAQTHLPQLNAMGLGVTITPRAGSFEEAQMSRAEEYASFTLSGELREIITRFPPLKVPFADYQITGNFQILGTQRIKNIVTPRPLMATGTSGGRKTGFIFGEGLWRWRLYDYSMSGSHEQFNELTDKLVQYLALRDNEDNFIIGFNPVYNETEAVVMTAEVVNDAFELITTPEVNIQITDSTGREYRYLFDRSHLFYRLDAGVFPPGRYAFSASTVVGNDKWSESGEFAVIPVNVELSDLRANHGMLFRLSFETGGKFFTEREMPLLVQELKGNNTIQTASYYQTAMNELLNLRSLFFLFLLLLSAEWFLRKFWGIY